MEAGRADEGVLAGHQAGKRAASLAACVVTAGRERAAWRGAGSAQAVGGLEAAAVAVEREAGQTVEGQWVAGKRVGSTVEAMAMAMWEVVEIRVVLRVGSVRCGGERTAGGGRQPNQSLASAARQHILYSPLGW